jgi:hypothetical protein
MRGSAWNQALAQGKRTVIPVGHMKHVSHADYFSRSMRLPSGVSYAEHTVAVIAEVVGHVLASTKPGQLAETVGAEEYLSDEGRSRHLPFDRDDALPFSRLSTGLRTGDVVLIPC